MGGSQQRLLRTSLDGAIPTFGVVGMVPVIATSSHLVVANSGLAQVLPVNDLRADPITLPGLDGLAFEGWAGPSDDEVWLIAEPFEWWQLWKIGAQPEKLREVRAPASLIGPRGDPEVFGSLSGGVYVGSAEDFEKVADGGLVAATPTHVVVENCDSPFDCETVWLSRSSWEPDETITPPPNVGREGWALVFGSKDGRFAFVVEPTASFLWDLTEGKLLKDELRSGAFSPDDRVFVGSTSSGFMYGRDLKTGEEVRSATGWFAGFSWPVFVPSTAP